MSSFLDDVINYIETENVATFGVDMFAGQYPSTAPDECILVKSTGGWPPYKEVDIRQPTIQILSRALHSPEAEENLRDVLALFHDDQAKTNYVIGSYHVYVSHAMQEPGDISPDEKGRAEWSVNISFKITTAPPVPVVPPVPPSP